METDEIFVCETGKKFDIGPAEDYFTTITENVPALRVHLEEYGERFGECIIRCAQDEGYWKLVNPSD